VQNQPLRNSKPTLVVPRARKTFGRNIASIQLNGDALLWAVDSSGNAHTSQVQVIAASLGFRQPNLQTSQNYKPQKLIL